MKSLVEFIAESAAKEHETTWKTLLDCIVIKCKKMGEVNKKTLSEIFTTENIYTGTHNENKVLVWGGDKKKTSNGSITDEWPINKLIDKLIELYNDNNAIEYKWNFNPGKFGTNTELDVKDLDDNYSFYFAFHDDDRNKIKKTLYRYRTKQ